MRCVRVFASLLIVVGMGAVARAGTIAQARSAALGSTVELTSVRVISTADLVNSSLTRTVQVDDGTGALTLIGGNHDLDSALAGATVGDRVSLRGVTQSQFGLFQITTPYVPLGMVQTGEVVVPETVHASDFALASARAESLESRVVTLRHARFVQKGQFAGLTTYSVTTATGTVSVRVPSNFLDVVAQAIPTGDVHLTGIFYQFDQNAPYNDGYQLYLRGTADIEAVPEPASVLALAAGLAGWATRRRRKA